MTFTRLLSLFRTTPVLALAVAGSAQALLGGQLLREDNPGWKNAVALLSISEEVLVGPNGRPKLGPNGRPITRERQGLCTGSLISNNTVLTAAHCLEGVKKVMVLLNPDLKGGQRLVGVEAAKGVIHPLYGKLPGNNFDIGFVKFRGDLPAGFAPLPILNTPALMPSGTPLTMVGYGKLQDRVKKDTSGVKRTIVNRSVKYIPLSMERGVPESLMLNLTVFGQSPVRGVCHGDSGGPAYIRTVSGWEIAGVMSSYISSRESPNCESGEAAIVTFPGDYIRWLRDAGAFN